MKAFIVLVFTVLSLNSFAQKAFEFKHYKAKTKQYEFRLALADGYILASEITKINLTTKKETKYLVNADAKNLTFTPDMSDKTTIRRKRDNVVLYKIKDIDGVLPKNNSRVI